MIKPKFIEKEPFKKKSLLFDELLKSAIDHIQKFSGNQWSDYNYHDPGITILEQLCFAITDLGYKTNFEIEDLLFAYTDKFDLENTNLLIPIEKILPSSPVTANDFRKIIIDRSDKVKNVWITPVDDNKLGIQGLYDVSVQCVEDINDHEAQEINNDISDILNENRALCTDFRKITILGIDIIKISANITINSFAIAENILAQIYHKIETKLNQELRVYEYDEIEQDNIQIFTGPLQKTKFIKEEDLNQKTNELYQFEIKEIIQSIEGIIKVEDFFIYKNDIKMFNNIISFDKNTYPKLDKETALSGFGPIQLKFTRNNTPYQIDYVIYKQFYDTIALKNVKPFASKLSIKKISNKGRYDKSKFEKYFSIQNELPSIYGLKQNELPSKSNAKRRAQVKQLKGYLYIFDQIMANYLAQLSNIRHFFSVDEDLTTIKTLYNKIPEDIFKIDDVIEKDNLIFIKVLNSLSENNDIAIKKKSEILDHILARFGEEFDTHLLTKLERLIEDKGNENDILINVLRAKQNYAKSIVLLGRNKNKAFNFKKNNSNFNISGLRHRLSLKLNIKNNSVGSTISPIFQNNDDETEIKWITSSISLNDKGPKIDIFSLDNKEYTDNNIHFYFETIQNLKSTFNYGIKRKNYQIIESAGVYNLLFNAPNFKFPVKISESQTSEDCELSIKKSISKIKNFNLESENFFIVENLLLRPEKESSFKLLVKSNSGTTVLESFHNTESNQVRDLKDDLWVLCCNVENYAIIKEKSTFRIVIYDRLNNKILQSKKTFNSKAVAAKEQQRILDLFDTNKKNKIDVNDFTEILVNDDSLNKFDDSFNYSNHLTIIFPDWPIRFQNNDFKTLVSETINTFKPAHIAFELYFLNYDKMMMFEDIYFNWLTNKINDDKDEIENYALMLIQFIKSLE